ncbi:hypothetical protein DFH08DRAFT_976786 [Mycena albidolilacea]|uniref:Uncharacterized protein n=1 Tax=Mycena albidolilacea TaxID=1033008 RepID=A0AAD6Z2M0_9AGAR|nr:hypothetical protein DFH08DRAFT_976786 [Mycena albidolilacea]
MPVRMRARAHTHDSSTDPPPSHNSENNNTSELESDHQVDSDKDKSDNDETYKQGGGEEAEGDQGEDDGQEDEEDELEDDSDLDPEIRMQAQNACAPVWQPWQDRLLIVQVNADHLFLMPRCSRMAAWNGTADVLAVSSVQQGQNSYFICSGEACKAHFNYLKKKYKADQARSLQKTGMDEEVNEFMELLGDCCLLLDSETASSSHTMQKKIDLEAQAGIELRDVSMRGLVCGDRLVDVASLASAITQERQGQRGQKRKGRDDEMENTSQSRNTTCKRRYEEQHAQQMGILNKLADCVQGLNYRISGMQDEQEKTNRYLHQQELEHREEAVWHRKKELGIHM